MRLRSRLVFSGTAAALATVLFATTASAAGTPGAAGAGDPYYPLDGNGGYNVSHYDLHLTYLPSADRPSGKTTITAKATKELSRFNLDFLLKVQSVKVNNAAATFAKGKKGELLVTPAAALPKSANFTVVVQYNDVPSTPAYTLNGVNSWTRTSTGALAVNEPHIAPWW